MLDAYYAYSRGLITEEEYVRRQWLGESKGSMARFDIFKEYNELIKKDKRYKNRFPKKPHYFYVIKRDTVGGAYNEYFTELKIIDLGTSIESPAKCVVLRNYKKSKAPTLKEFWNYCLNNEYSLSDRISYYTEDYYC